MYINNFLNDVIEYIGVPTTANIHALTICLVFIVLFAVFLGFLYALIEIIRGFSL